MFLECDFLPGGPTRLSIGRLEEMEATIKDTLESIPLALAEPDFTPDEKERKAVEASRDYFQGQYNEISRLLASHSLKVTQDVA